MRDRNHDRSACYCRNMSIHCHTAAKGGRMMDWISVNDKLPQPVEEYSVVIFPWVLAYSPMEDPGFIIAAYDHNDEMWVRTTGFDIWYVTHWMPLDEPWEGAV